MKKLLILNLASLEEPYNTLLNTSKRTWDNDNLNIDGIKTVYYFSAPDDPYIGSIGEGLIIGVDCPDDYYMMHWRLKLALDEVWDMEWDYIFRTNISSYIHKPALLAKIQELPNEKVYCGYPLHHDGLTFATGSGFILSRDCVQILRDSIKNKIDTADDLVVAQILKDNGIEVTPGQWYPIYPERGPVPKDIYHYRCKSLTDDRTDDIKAMEWLFEYLNP